MYKIEKASMLKRISAFLLDFILMTIAVTGFAFLISVITGRQNYVDAMDAREEVFEAEYGVDFDISDEEYEALSDAEQSELDRAYVLLNEDAEYIYNFNMLINLTLIMISIGLLLSHILLEMVIPIILKNGQTVGKKVFNLGVVHVNAVRLTGVGLFTRAILGKYTVETMIPVIMILMMLLNADLSGIIVLGLLVILEVFVFFKNKMNTPVHDVLSHTVCVDLSVQMIYDSEDELIKHKERLHAEAVQDANY